MRIPPRVIVAFGAVISLATVAAQLKAW